MRGTVAPSPRRDHTLGGRLAKVRSPQLVIAGLDPAIHLLCKEGRMRGSSSGQARGQAPAHDESYISVAGINPGAACIRTRMRSMTKTPDPIRIYVDADACPVKDEIYRVAARHGLPVTVVANGFIRVPQDPLIDRVAAGAGLDAADNWIAERAGPGSIVITTDIPLASRCVKAGAEVIAPNGRAFTEAAMGMTLAVRNLMHDLRSAGEVTGGPPPFSPRDRSAFLSALDQAIRRLQRARLQR